MKKKKREAIEFAKWLLIRSSVIDTPELSLTYVVDGNLVTIEKAYEMFKTEY